MKQVTVREYALLTATLEPKVQGFDEIDHAEITETAFDYLCELAARFSTKGASLLQVAGRRKLKLDNYVGVIETPCGTCLEILPKHIEKIENADKARDLLRKMLTRVLDLPYRESDDASLSLYQQPLHEWIIRQFLIAFEHLIHKGIRFNYQRIDEDEKFLRGQLDIVKKMRQPVGRAHIFPIRHDIFTPDRPENRLLRSALERICRATQEAQNWRLAQELRLLTNEIPVSKNIDVDFRQWQDDRLLAHYKAIRPWCELVLGQFMPVTVQGDWRGISLLFPMEKLFERYVAACLSRSLTTGFYLREQASFKSLCHHQWQGQTEHRDCFRLKPDLLIEYDNQAKIVLDTKWKRLNIHEKRYGLKDSDLQQMFAYSHFYLKHSENLILIYPAWESFKQPLPPFKFKDTDEKAVLWVLPFDLDNDELIIPTEPDSLSLLGFLKLTLQ